ncbi:MAG: hypothetical protein MZV70_51885 [Desulfobacterales bacterium]|nr:hypothetical protein [Desulfobacterales bacterium]
MIVIVESVNFADDLIATPFSCLPAQRPDWPENLLNLCCLAIIEAN